MSSHPQDESTDSVQSGAGGTIRNNNRTVPASLIPTTAAAAAAAAVTQSTGDSSHNVSLSTTPTQTQGGVLSAAASRDTLRSSSTTRPATQDTSQDAPTSRSRSVSQRDSILSSGDTQSQGGSLGRGQPPRSALSGTRSVSRSNREPSGVRSQGQRSVSYAPSDMDTVSGMSASEYSSGEEGGAPQAMSASARSSSRPSAPRTDTGISRASTAKQQGSGGRRKSNAAIGRRTSVVARDDDNDDRYGPLDDEDDEVDPIDRGAELVRRRHKERARERKKAEKERARLAAQATPSSPRTRPISVATARATSPNPQGEGRQLHIALPSPGIVIDNNTLSPFHLGSDAQSNPGTPRAAGGATSYNYPSPHSHIRRPGGGQPPASIPGRRSSATSGLPGSAAARSSTGTVTQRGQDVFSDAGHQSSSEAGIAQSSVAGSVVEDDEEEEDEHRDTIGHLATDSRGAKLQAADPFADDAQTAEDHEDDEDFTPSGEGSDVDGDGDVEYTLKDRQDAINIEHPFGLPIWKPALYKKSRSVTRNAETALHLIPSAAAERHLLPGNLLWTIFFGWWLSMMCITAGLVLGFVPWGGAKYARVAFGLGSYLFWPFGKYVEVEVSHESGERLRGFVAANGEDDGAGAYTSLNGDGPDSYEENITSFTPVAARFPHDHAHRVPFNSRATRPVSQDGSAAGNETIRPADDQAESSSSGPSSTPGVTSDEGTAHEHNSSSEGSLLKGKGLEQTSYGATQQTSEEEAVDRVEAETGIYSYVFDDEGREIGAKGRALGAFAYGLFFWLLIAPVLGIVCLMCWGLVITIPMAKLTWVLLKNLATQPLALHFRSAPTMDDSNTVEVQSDDAEGGVAAKFLRPLRPGQMAPRSKSYTLGNRDKTSLERRSKILLCTYRAVGSQYYKYTVGGVNILFVNTLPLVAFTIFDFFFIEPYVHKHHITGGLFPILAGQGTIFILALLSVIPLSYFIGMAVASISAQSSIGMGAVINATFGSIIEIILYAIALTQQKARLVEGSLVGSILAGVLLMPGLSMCSGATRRKEQRFNARSAGVTSTMLIMAIIGILTPTLFYQIYGTFQLTCQGCPPDGQGGEAWTCKRCFYEHVPPATDPFYQDNVKSLMYTCTVILVLSYGIGLWFSLRTHASQIWQNALPATTSSHQTHTGTSVPTLPSAQRASIYKRLVPASVMQQLLPTHRPQSQASQPGAAKTSGDDELPPLRLPENLSQEDYARAVAITASAFQTAIQQQQQHHDQHTVRPVVSHSANQAMPRPHPPAESVARHVSVAEADDDGGHGGHDAPSWSRGTSVSVLLGCTVLYAIIAEILVDVVDVVLDGSGIDEKFLGITLFALVPNTTEFMNAMSFAINGNIALSMEIGSAYALQVCLIQIPAMVAFSAWYNATHVLPGSPIHYSFTLIFPRWDVIAIIFSVFLLTYTYIEARSNYYRGSICILSYLVLVAGFFFAPSAGDSEMPGDGEIPGLQSTLLALYGGLSSTFAGTSVDQALLSFPTLQGAWGAMPAVPSTLVADRFGVLQNAAAPMLHGARWVAAMLNSLFTR